MIISVYLNDRSDPINCEVGDNIPANEIREHFDTSDNDKYLCFKRKQIDRIVVKGD